MPTYGTAVYGAATYGVTPMAPVRPGLPPTPYGYTPDVRNLLPNPSFENGFAHWLPAVGPNGTWDLDATRAWVGATSARLTIDHGPLTFQPVHTLQHEDLVLSDVGLMVGDSLAFRMNINVDDPSLFTSIALNIQFWKYEGNDTTTIRIDHGAFGRLHELVPGVWSLLPPIERSVIPAGTAWIALRVYLTEQLAPPAVTASRVRLDGVQFEVAERPSVYTDGDQPFCIWEGVPHDSPSYRPPMPRQGLQFRGGPKRLERRMWRADVNNVKVEEITDHVTSAQVVMDVDQTIKQTLSVGLIDPSIIQPYSDYLAPEVTITEVVSGDTVTSQLGLYRVGLPSTVRHPTVVLGTVETEDLISLLIKSGVGDTPYNLRPGSNYMDAARAQCQLAGITRIRFPDDARTVPAGKTHSKPAGTARCRIVFDIMQLLGYLNPWCDNEGWLTTRMTTEPGTESPARTYRDGDDSDLVGEAQSDPMATTLANKITVTYDDVTTGTTRSATRINNNPASPSSIPKIGEIFRHEGMTEAADQAAVDAYADQLVEQWGDVLMHLSLRTPLDPLRGVWESADVHIHEGREDGGISGTFRISGYIHDLGAGTTLVNLRRHEGFGNALGDG